MKKISIFYIFIILFLCSFSGNNFIFKEKIALKSDNLYLDKLNNIYYINSNNLFKIDNNNNKTYNYNLKSFGKISSIDILNPWKILVFNKDFNIISFLDNSLSVTGNSINLNNLGFNKVKLACTSFDDGFWIFEEENFQLIKFDKNLTKKVQSANLSQLINPDINATSMFEYNEYIFLINNYKAVYIIDKFGTYNKSIPLINTYNHKIVNNKIYFLENSFLSYYDLSKNITVKIDFFNFAVKDYALNENMILLSNQDSVMIYNIK